MPSMAAILGGATAFSFALGLKAFYSRAGANELLWILAPSAWLARWVGGIDLVYEQDAGFISYAHRLVVGPACAGVNFLIICFLCLYFSFAGRRAGKAQWLACSFLIAFGATVAANSLRIFVSAHLWTARFYAAYFSAEEMHRVAGIAIYYASLLAIYFAVESRIGRSGPAAAPLLWYLAVSLGVPLAGRIAAGLPAGFAGHAVWVFGIATALTLVKALPSLMRNRIH